MSKGALIVTGGAAGIGRAIAARLVKDGHTVVIADRDAGAAARTASEIGADHVAIDIGDEASVVAGVAAVVAKHDGLFGLVNNAGVHMQALVVEMRAEEGALAFRLNTDELVIAGPENPLRAAGDPEVPAIYLAVRRGCEARLNRSTYLQLIERALAGGGLTVSSRGATFALVPA